MQAQGFLATMGGIDTVVEEEEAMRLFDNRDLTVEVFFVFFVRGRYIYGR